MCSIYAMRLGSSLTTCVSGGGGRGAGVLCFWTVGCLIGGGLGAPPGARGGGGGGGSGMHLFVCVCAISGHF